jgi:hypothetical protein
MLQALATASCGGSHAVDLRPCGMGNRGDGHVNQRWELGTRSPNTRRDGKRKKVETPGEMKHSGS